MSEKVPLYDPTNVVGEEVLDDIRDVLESGWLTMGEKTRQFEAEFARRHGTEHAVALNSCTSGLYASLRALGIGDGDTVVVPAVTFAATANVVRLLGADVLLCDVKNNGNIDPEVLEGLLETHEVDAVVPVHLYGLPADMTAVCDLAADHDAVVVEDAAQAHAAHIDGRPVGSFGDAGCFSFYATKNVTTGEGGMVVTDDDDLAEKVRQLRNHHQTKDPDEKEDNWGYDVDGLGFNFRTSEINAAMGVSQLSRLGPMTESRTEVASRYIDAISDIDGLSWEGGRPKKGHAFHLFVVQVHEEYPMTRDELYDWLSQHDVVTGVHYPPISELTFYEDAVGEFTNAERLYDRILSLPMYPDMHPDDQERVISLLARGGEATEPPIETTDSPPSNPE